MRCRDFERLACDYVDETLGPAERRAVDEHRLECSACAEALEEAVWGRMALARAPAVEPPPDLIADIIHETIGVGATRLAPAGAGGGLLGALRPLFHPFLQPRFVMGMAMTALSFSMLTFYGQRAFENWRSGESSPVSAVQTLGDQLGAFRDELVEMFDAAREFYRLQTEYAQPREAGDPARTGDGGAEEGRPEEPGAPEGGER